MDASISRVDTKEGVFSTEIEREGGSNAEHLMLSLHSQPSARDHNVPEALAPDAVRNETSGLEDTSVPRTVLIALSVIER